MGKFDGYLLVSDLDGTLIVSDAGFGRMQFAICTTDPETFDKAMDMLRDIRDALEDN